MISTDYLNNDIFLVSYPRSGNTWMRYLLANILRPDCDWHIKNLNDVVPDIYQVSIKNYTGSKIIKSHEPYTEDYPKVIYMYRDGRDVAVSYYNLSKTAFGYSGSFDDFLLAMLTGCSEVAYGSWQDHVAGWLDAQKDGNIFYIKYEELYDNTVETIMKLGDFMGKEISKDQILSAIEKSTFNVQKEHVKKYSEHYANGFRGGVKGGPGKWREVFSGEMNDLFWSYAGNIMTRLGYTKL